MFECTKILNNPKHVFGAAHTMSCAGRKARCACIAGENLMQCTLRKASAQNRITVRMA